MDSFIKIEKISLITDSKIEVFFSFSKDLERFFTKTSFTIEYEESIADVGMEILSIPAVSSLINVAWLNDADLYVDSLNETFYKSLQERKQLLKTWYPMNAFKTEIKTKLVSKEYHGEGVGLLFSGGVDAHYSFLRNECEKPELYMVIGSEIPFDKKEYIGNAKKVNKDFAEKRNLPIHYVETNLRDAWDESILNATFGKILSGYSFYEAFNIGLSLTGLCAPLTVKRTNVLIISSSYTQNYNQKYGSDPELDATIRWANLRVIHDGYDAPRSEKVRVISRDIERRNEPVILRVCNYAPLFTSKLNCSRCEKCYRTMIQLLIYGIDPNKCGFHYSPDTLSNIKGKIEANNFFTHEDKIWFWQDLQRSIPENVTGTQKFLEFIQWLKMVDLNKIKLKDDSLKKRFLSLYSLFPTFLRKLVRERYSQTDI